jgi:RNA polymerase primary sigma factor
MAQFIMRGELKIDPNDPVSLYLREIGQFPLLSKKDERILAEFFHQKKEKHTKNKKDKKAKGQKKKKGKLKFPHIQYGDTVITIRSKKMARDMFVKSNLRLVVSISKTFVGRSTDMELLDLINEGNLGLFKAVDKFDWRRGFKFSTYATWWIRQNITRALSDKTRTIRVPVHMTEKIFRMKKAERQLFRDLEREPSSLEVAIKMKEGVEVIHQMKRADQKIASLDMDVGSGGELSTLGELIADDAIIPADQESSRRILKEQVKKILVDLSPKYKKIIEMRFGLNGEREHTLEDIGKDFGVTRERIRQIEQQALEKIRQSNNSERLKDYWSREHDR